jgi:hypothetical protein
MSAIVQMPVAAAADREPVIIAKRICFVPVPQPGTIVCCKFPQAYSCVAVEELVDPSALATEGANSPANLTMVLVPSDAAAKRTGLAEDWTARGAAVPTISVAAGAQKIKWCPGRAVVQAPTAALEHAQNALVAFAFYEGELRRLEEGLGGHDTQARADIARAQVIRFRDRRHWRRLTELSELFWRMRFDHSRIAADLAALPRGFPTETKQLITRLLDQVDIEARLEAVSDQLEACEDLYDGATDRIAEYRWFFGSSWLEASIVVLLLIEIGLLSAELYFTHLK